MLKIWRLIQVILICLLISFWSFPSYALSTRDISNPRQTYGGWITDEASIISDRTEKQLNQQISQLKSNTGIELAIVTVPETSPAPSVKSFTTELFNYWKIGQAKENNGILFLISIGDRRVEIETGSGIEKILSNSEINQIIEEEIKPRFRTKMFDLGVTATTTRLINELEAEVPNKSNFNFRYLIAFVILGLFWLLGWIVSKYEEIKAKKIPYPLDKSLIERASKRRDDPHNPYNYECW